MPVTDVNKDLDALTLTITAEFDAGAERVWEMWSDPRQLERWWGPPNFPATFVEHDLSRWPQRLLHDRTRRQEAPRLVADRGSRAAQPAALRGWLRRRRGQAQRGDAGDDRHGDDHRGRRHRDDVDPVSLRWPRGDGTDDRDGDGAGHGRSPRPDRRAPRQWGA